MHRVKKVIVTGAAGQIAYSALFRIAAGEMLGKDQPIELRLLDIEEMKGALQGVVMELEDCAFPLITGIHSFTNADEAFEGAEIALLLGSKPRGPGMERKDLLSENAKIFIEQGKALNTKASPDVIVLVVGNPCNTNALITLHHAPNLDRRRIFAMTRLDQNRAKAQLAMKANAKVEEVTHLTIWGNHSSTMVPDFVNTRIGSRWATETIDRPWLENDFFQTVQQRGAAVIAARGKSSAASAASAAIDTIRSLMTPTPSGDWFSVGMISNGNPYQIQNDLIFSFPCRSRGNGQVEIVHGLNVDPFLKKKIALSEKELLEEREILLYNDLI